jgi:glycosyltransferase involved in cell wall biosynthesis
MKKISTVIITKNEEKNIERCLKSVVEVSDEIIIIDSFSTDKTQQIANSFPKVNFVQHEWEGYSGSKNYGHSIAKNNWILSIDADEALSDKLIESIKKAKEIDENTFYRFARLTNYCGSWIYHCNWYPDFKVRLFNKNTAKWVGESIHEQLIFDKSIKVKTLKGDCFHYTISTMEGHLEKINKYSSLWAREAYAKGKKKGWFELIFKPLTSFFNVYFFKLGFLDGFHGFVISLLAAHSKFQRISKLMNLHKTGEA